jgi:hypothetical protein
MSKKKLVIIIVVSVIAGILIPLAIQVYHYGNMINEPRLNLTKIQERLDNGGSLDDPVTPDLYEPNKLN